MMPQIPEIHAFLSEDHFTLLTVLGPIVATLFVAHALYKRIRPYPSVSFHVPLPERTSRFLVPDLVLDPLLRAVGTIL